MEELTRFKEQLVEFLPNLLGALGILVVGWIVAVLLGRVMQALLDRTSLDEKTGEFLAGDGKKAPPVDRWISGAIRWLVLLYTLVLVFTTLELDSAIVPLNELLGGVLVYVPKILIGLLLMVIAWAVATGLRTLVTKVLAAVQIDRRLQALGADEEDAEAARPVGEAIGTAVYWLVWFVFVLMLLEVLELHGLLEPLTGMANEVFAFLPNLLSAVVILFVGWLIATVVRRVTAKGLHAVGVDDVSERAGLSKIGKGSVSDLLATVAFLLLLLPVLAMALDALQLEAVSAPVSGLLDTFFQAIPKLLVAALILGVAFVLGRLLGSLVGDLLARLGFDSLVATLGLSRARAAVAPEGEAEDAGSSPSVLVGRIVTWAVLLFAVMEAAEELDLGFVSQALGEFVGIAAGWLFGLLIFGLGLWLARVVADVVRDSESPNSRLLATAARVAISVLAGIAALEHMDIADDVVVWGSVALIASTGLALALAFGLGARDAAAAEVERWREARDAADEEDRALPVSEEAE